MSKNENNLTKNNINQNDTFDINELTSLSDEITTDFIEQLQSQVEENAKTFTKNTSDGDLFEDVEEKKFQHEVAPTLNTDIDDNFIKKYKAKLKKQQENKLDETEQKSQSKTEAAEETVSIGTDSTSNQMTQNTEDLHKQPDIEKISGGNISERPLTEDIKNYVQSLDYTDDNTKYSKYVIYIDPENEDFIESLTVKERKNLINKIIKEQNSIAITKSKIYKLKTFLIHSIITILTIAIAVPCLYKVINASLEITIDNYTNSQSMFETLYKQKGKIKSIKR